MSDRKDRPAAVAESFDVHYINLKHREDRRKAMVERCAKAGMKGERLEAKTGADVVGDTEVGCTWDSTINSRYDKSTVAHPALRMSDGERGCALSHITLWRRCAAQPDDAPPLLILEDDAELCEDFKLLCAGCVASMQSHFPVPAERNTVLFLGARVAAWRLGTVVIPVEVSATFMLREVEYLWWAGCYVLWPAAARHLLQLLPLWAPVDVAISEVILRGSLRAFVPIPMLSWSDNVHADDDGVLRHPEGSDILHTNRYAASITVDASLQTQLDACQQGARGGSGSHHGDGVGGEGDRAIVNARAAPSSARSGCACFTIARDEPVYLPRWHAHYKRAFANADLYLLHHVVAADEQAEGAFADAIALFDPGNVSRLINADFDPAWLREVVVAKLTSLLERYEAVLFAESDELLCAPLQLDKGGLRSYIDEFLAGSEPSIRCVGYEVHHEFPMEPPLNLDEPVLLHRNKWHRNIKYDKALLTRHPLHWSLGFHECDEDVRQDEKGLILVHLHKMDFQLYISRHEARARYKHSDEAIKNGWNTHYRSSGPALMAQYMSLPAPLEEIPAWAKVALGGV